MASTEPSLLPRLSASSWTRSSAMAFASTRRTIDSLAKAQVERRRVAGIREDRATRSAEHGRSLGAAILAWAATDGFFDTRKRTWSAPKAREQWANTSTQDQFVPLMLSGESDLVAVANPGVAVDLERSGERFVFTNAPRTPRDNAPHVQPVRPTEPYWARYARSPCATGMNAGLPPPAYSEKQGRTSGEWERSSRFMTALTPEKKQVALFWADNPVRRGRQDSIGSASSIR